MAPALRELAPPSHASAGLDNQQKATIEAYVRTPPMAYPMCYCSPVINEESGVQVIEGPGSLRIIAPPELERQISDYLASVMRTPGYLVSQVPEDGTILIDIVYTGLSQQQADALADFIKYRGSTDISVQRVYSNQEAGLEMVLSGYGLTITGAVGDVWSIQNYFSFLRQGFSAVLTESEDRETATMTVVYTGLNGEQNEALRSFSVSIANTPVTCTNPYDSVELERSYTSITITAPAHQAWLIENYHLRDLLGARFDDFSITTTENADGTIMLTVRSNAGLSREQAQVLDRLSWFGSIESTAFGTYEHPDTNVHMEVSERSVAITAPDSAIRTIENNLEGSNFIRNGVVKNRVNNADGTVTLSMTQR